MADLREFKLPDVGEGLTEGEVLTWFVKVGDTVVVNQVVVEVETAKAAVELPIPWAGVVTELHAEVGVTIPVGTPLLTIDVSPQCVVRRKPLDEAPDSDGGAAEGARPEMEFVPSGPPPTARREAVLVGYGVREAAVTRRPRRARPLAPAGPATTPSPSGLAGRVFAKPPVRKLAKDLGVDLAGVTATGPGGTVTRDDVLGRVSRSGSPWRTFRLTAPATPRSTVSWWRLRSTVSGGSPYAASESTWPRPWSAAPSRSRTSPCGPRST